MGVGLAAGGGGSGCGGGVGEWRWRLRHWQLGVAGCSGGGDAEQCGRCEWQSNLLELHEYSKWQS